MSWRIFNTRNFGDSEIMMSPVGIENHVREYSIRTEEMKR